MIDVRALVVAVVLGAGLAIYLDLWVHLATFLAVGAGAFVALVTLLIAAAIGDDPAEADQAWREAAPDLVVRRLGPGDADDGRPS